jgi:hypothetical protein
MVAPDACERFPMTPQTRARHDKIDKTGVFTLVHSFDDGPPASFTSCSASP